MAKTTLVDVIEAAYELELSGSSWSHAVASKIRAYCGNDRIMMMHFDASLPPEQRFFGVAVPELGRLFEKILEASMQRTRLVTALEARFGPPDLFPPIAGLATMLGESPLKSPIFAPFARIFDFVDLIALGANDGTGRGLIINLPVGARKQNAEPLRRVRNMRRALPHLSAALRLRRALSPEQPSQPGPGGAVLDVSGRLQDGALSPPLRDRLREAVLARDRARTLQGRESPQELDGWTALVDGRWSLIDLFEENGRRYVVAHPNLPEVRDPRYLEPLERVVFSGLSRGLSNKAMGYELGLTEGTIAGYVRSLRLKMGGVVREARLTRAPLVDELNLSGFELMVLVCESPGREFFAELPPAERAVLLDLLAGYSNATIAERRGVSVRTIANQVASGYRRLGVASRRDLIAKVGREK